MSQFVDTAVARAAGKLHRGSQYSCIRDPINLSCSSVVSYAMTLETILVKPFVNMLDHPNGMYSASVIAAFMRCLERCQRPVSS